VGAVGSTIFVMRATHPPSFNRFEQIRRLIVMIQGKLRLATVQGVQRQFVAQSGSGHAFVIDDAEGATGAKPIELALLALGGCTAFDVINILRKKRQVVSGYEIELEAEQAEEPPNYFTHIYIRHRLRGHVDSQAVESAIHLSESKYCSVGAMISKTAKIEHTFEILEPDVPSLPSSYGIETSQVSV
jgi:putative redox protein